MLRRRWKRFLSRHPNASLADKIRWDAFDRPDYAYGTYIGAQTARALNLPRISVIEFGVAGGNGLLSLETIAEHVSQATGVMIDVYGFDSGIGLPTPSDYRDMPFIWAGGDYQMDAEALRKRLKRAQLVLGDIEHTVETFAKDYDPAPIGFIAWDVDYYSSAKSAMKLLDEPHNRFLPRTICYFDDIVGPDYAFSCEWLGELLAISEFNESHKSMKISRIYGLEYKRPLRALWHCKTFVLHRFEHPDYCAHIYDKNLQLPLS